MAPIQPPEPGMSSAGAEFLPFIERGVTVFQASSHNKEGLNGDGGFWLYSEEGSEPGLCGWMTPDEGVIAGYSTEHVHSGRGAMCHRILREAGGPGWRSLIKVLSAGLNVSDFDTLRLWIWPTYADGGVDYGVRIDSGTQSTDLLIRDLRAGEWNEVVLDIRDVPRAGLSRLWLLFHVDWGCEQQVDFYVDDIAFGRPDGSALVVDDFETGQEWRVVMDSLGPGCVRSMWGLGGGRLRVELDGQTYVEADQSDLYDGLTPQFRWPLVSRHCVSTGEWRAEAHWSFVPLPFRERCRILTTAPLPFNHYIYERYRDPGRASWERARQDEARYCADWAHIGQDPKPWDYRERIRGAASVAPGGQTEIARLAGAGTIGAIKLRISPTSDSALAGARLRIYWDGEEVPSVDAPLGILFGCGVSWQPVPSLMIGTRGDTGYCYFPMPYWEGARLVIENQAEEERVRLNWEIACTDETYPGATAGYFRTHFNHDPATAVGRDYLFLDTGGRGQFVGVVHTMVGGHYCEGDIRFYRDRSRTPQLYGTGTEDYYHCACWPNSNHHTPFHGCVGDITAQAHARGVSIYDLRSCYYRFHLEAPIRFLDGVRLGIEHGGNNDTVSDYTSLAYYYHQPDAGLHPTDAVRIGDPASEAAHELQGSGMTRGVVSGFFEGSDDKVRWTFGALRSTQSVSVVLRIEPSNAGVRLRRVFDQWEGRQRVAVFVGGQYAGDWYDPDENRFMRLAESDFEVPTLMTAGKRRIAVEFRPCSDSPPWTILELQAMCYTPG